MFGQQALGRLREVFLAPEGQPFVVAGSGTLAMDLAGANLVGPAIGHWSSTPDTLATGMAIF